MSTTLGEHPRLLGFLAIVCLLMLAGIIGAVAWTLVRAVIG